MEYTKGTWEVSKLIEPEGSFPRYYIEGEHNTNVAMIDGRNSNARDDAHLIAAVVNACTSVNPDNPMAVAESIKEMYEALKQVEIDYEALCNQKPKNTLLQARLRMLKQALAKAVNNG